MKNKLANLNDHLFAQLERLSDEDMSEEQIKQEGKRAMAIVAVSDQIVGNARLRLNAASLFAQHGDRILPYLPEIGSADKSTNAKAANASAANASAIEHVPTEQGTRK